MIRMDTRFMTRGCDRGASPVCQACGRDTRGGPRSKHHARGYSGTMGGRRIAIIGSGQEGLVAAHGLVRAGHEVKLYSDRSADAWLNESKPTGTAARFWPVLAYERELGLAHWEAEAPGIRGIHLTFSPKVGTRLLTMAARVQCEDDRPGGQAIDLRLQSHRWMNDLGDCVVVEKITALRGNSSASGPR